MRDAQCVLALQGKKKIKTCEREINAHAFRFCTPETEEQALLSASSMHTLQTKFVALHAIIIPRGKNGGALPLRILDSLPEHFDSFRTHMVLFWIFLLEEL